MLMVAISQGQLECVRALLDAGADVMQQHAAYGLTAIGCASQSLEMLQLLCAYAPSRQAVLAQLARAPPRSAECAQWLDDTRRWSSALHHFELLSLERVRALLVEGADVHAGDGGADAPTPLGIATERLLRGADDRAALIVAAAAPWSPATHALFPAAAKARAVALLRLGWLLARQLQGVQDEAEVEGALRDAWLGHVMPHAIERASA